MSRKIEEYKRQPRKRNSIILIGVEGSNQTESLYFKNYNACNTDFKINIAKGNSTDPVGIVKELIGNMEYFDINPKEDNNKVYCIFDIDTSKEKEEQIKKAIKLAKKNNIEIITSNPCFEDWFLCHFIYTTKSFTNKEIIKELNKYIKYRKNSNIYNEIKDKTKEAIKNAKKQNKYHEKLNQKIDLVEGNPSTTVYKIVEDILNRK